MPTGSMTRTQPRASDGLPVMASSPGYLIRRAQQVHVSLWQKHIEQNLTSVQYGVLLVLGQRHAIDQTSVAEMMSLDKNTAADVLRRLRNRAVVARAPEASILSFSSSGRPCARSRCGRRSGIATSCC